MTEKLCGSCGKYFQLPVWLSEKISVGDIPYTCEYVGNQRHHHYIHLETVQA